MGRIRQMLRVDGREAWALFDSGARNTYVVPEAAALLTTTKVPSATHIRLGGETKTSTVAAVLVGEIEARRSTPRPW
jgi:hypothetical protein